MRNAGTEKLRLASNASTDIKARGRVWARTEDMFTKKFELSDTLFVPDVHINLMSVGKNTDKGTGSYLNVSTQKIVSPNGHEILTAKRSAGLYYVETSKYDECMATVESQVLALPDVDKLRLWL